MDSPPPLLADKKPSRTNMHKILFYFHSRSKIGIQNYDDFENPNVNFKSIKKTITNEP